MGTSWRPGFVSVHYRDREPRPRTATATATANRDRAYGVFLPRRWLALLVAVALPPFSSPTAAAAETSTHPRAEASQANGDAKVADPELRASLAAIENGLRYLKGQQLESGAFGARFPVAVTALSGMAYLGAGHGLRSAHGPTLRKAVRFLIETGREQRAWLSDKDSRMHGHTYAVLFLCQIYGEIPTDTDQGREAEDVRRTIEDGVKLILRCQSPRGGWFYTPEERDKDEGSLTICALQALRSANGIGFRIPKAPIDAAVGYVKRSQTRDGSFLYSLSGVDDAGRTSFALTVAAIAALHAAGEYDAREIRLGLDFVRLRFAAHPSEPFRAAEKEWFFYANIYAAQALYQVGGELWSQWYPSARRQLLKRQREDGSFEDREYGDPFGTAAALLILEVPLSYLPIFQR